MTAFPSLRSLESRIDAMLIPDSASREATAATCPGLSSLCTIIVGMSPEKSVSSPSIRQIKTLPPPGELATISSSLPLLPVSRSFTLFGWTSFKNVFPNLHWIPSSLAISKLCGIIRSSCPMPRSPAMTARSVPCPTPVA